MGFLKLQFFSHLTDFVAKLKSVKLLIFFRFLLESRIIFGCSVQPQISTLNQFIELDHILAPSVLTLNIKTRSECCV